MNLFSSIQIKNIKFANRIVMAPMVPYPISSYDSGSMHNALINFYKNRSNSDIGLIISQSLDVSTNHKTEGFAAIRSQEHRQPLEMIADLFHQNNTRFFAQLAFPKIGSHENQLLNDMSTNEMQHLIDDFVTAARLSKASGCDGIELHGAHGYFLNMLLSEEYNHRKDAYGGSLENRLRFISEVIDKIGRFSDDNFIISYRMGWSDSAETDIQIAAALEKMGVNLLHISYGLRSTRKFDLPENYPYNKTVYAGTLLKKSLKIPITVVDDIQTLSRGNHLIENNLSDFVAYGRPFLADCDFVRNSSNDPHYRPCIKCKKCLWFTDGTLCPANRKNS